MLTTTQRIALYVLGFCAPASVIARTEREGILGTVLTAIWVAALAIVLWRYRRYDWRGPLPSLYGETSVAFRVLLGVFAVIAVADVVRPGHAPPARVAAVAIELGVIPRSLQVRAPTSGATPAGYAAYVDRLCSAAAPYLRRLVLDVGVLDRYSRRLPAASQAVARTQTADAFDLLSSVVSEEGQVLAVEAPSRRVPPPPAETSVARQLQSRFARLVALERMLSDRYHRIAASLRRGQTPTTAEFTASTSAGTAATAARAAAIASVQRRLGAHACDRVPEPAG